MRRFFFGVIFTLVVLGLGGLGYVLLGYVQTAADATPPGWKVRMFEKCGTESKEKSATLNT